MSNPDEIRAQIEQTRSNLSTDVNTLADTVNPASVARRQTDKVKGAVFGVREKVMGAASDAGSSAGDKASSLSDAVSGAPQTITTKTSGNPLAAGVIAFGVGMLLGSLLPASSVEQDAAGKLKDAATPLVSDAAKEVAGNLKEPAQQAVESVKSTATDAAATVKDEGTSAAQDVKDQAQSAKENVQSAATS